jgi:hypothetical protein
MKSVAVPDFRLEHFKTRLHEVLVKGERPSEAQFFHQHERETVHKAELFIGVSLEELPGLAILAGI